MKSPAAKMPQKPYKHIEFIEFKNIREIVDVRDNDGRELVHLLLVIAMIIQTSNKSRLQHTKTVQYNSDLWGQSFSHKVHSF